MESALSAVAGEYRSHRVGEAVGALMIPRPPGWPKAVPPLAGRFATGGGPQGGGWFWIIRPPPPLVVAGGPPRRGRDASPPAKPSRAWDERVGRAVSTPDS